jgi:hypothetical protein
MKRAHRAHHAASNFLTVIAWPRGGAEHAIASLSKAIGTDVPTLRFAAARSTPSIIATLPADACEAGRRAIHAAGGDAMCVSLAELESFGDTRKIRSIAVRPGRLDLVLWRGESRHEQVSLASIDVVVRATIKRVGRRSFDTAGGDGINVAPLPRSLRRSGFGFLDSAPERPEWSDLATTGGMPVPAKQIDLSEKLDMHAADGRVYQVDGDKFAFAVLGDLRAPSDRPNMDALCDLLAHLAPHAAIDRYFELFRAPPEFERLRVARAAINADDPAFAFYSRWTAVITRRLLSGGAVGGVPADPGETGGSLSEE